MSEAVLQAKIKAFDEFTSLFQKYQSELKKMGSAQNEAAQSAKNANRSFGDFLTTVGSVGAIYAFQQALRATMDTGRDFELTIKQAQAVTGDFSSTLRNLAMTTKGGNLDTFGPTQLAEAYRELGASGATTNDIIAATPDILEFGTAALLDMDQAAFSVLATAKSFNIAISDSGQIVDAYTQAMNQGALAGQDFQWIMSSAGAVAKMTGQDFQEILSIGSAMRDSGIQAQDAGTAIKSALMALMNPSDEARRAMKDLGISIYDSSGQMKQWSDITAEFERALGPLDEQSKQLALGTIFGADGIRTMAVSMNKGSDYLRTFSEGLKSADGATHEMASAMSDTYDGAAKKFNASLERTKILLFEDIAPAAGVALGALNTLLLGFQSLDDGTRQFIEILVGGTGLVFALAAVTTAIRTLLPLLAAFGIGTSALAGPIGIAIGVVGALTTAYIAHKGAVAQSTLEQANNIKTIEGQINAIPTLVKQYESLINNTNRTAAEEAALQQVTADLASVMPQAISGFDSFGNAIFNTGNLADVAKGKISSLKQEVVGYYKLKADMAKDQLPELNKQFKSYNDDLQSWQKQMQANNSGKWDINLFGKTYTNPLAGEMGNNDYVQEQIRGLQSKQAKLYEDKIQLERDMAIYDSISKGTYWNKQSAPTTSSNPPGSSWSPAKSGGGGKNTTLDAAKSLTEAIDNAILPYRNAVELAGIAVGTLSSKEQFLTQVIEGGNGTAADALALNQTRVQQLTQLSQQQDVLHQQAEAERVALAKVQEQLAAANNPEVVKELQSEMVNLERSIAQAGQAWVQAEQQKIAMMNRIKAEEDKRYNDAYQKAMDLMRHQINMANMSTEEQIRYLEKLRDAHEWTQQQMWELEENLYQLRRQQLTEMLDEIDEEYQSQLDRIESRTDKAAKAIQDQIDALDKKSQDNSREDAQYRYNQKIQELTEKRHYHELRTGKDHAEAIAEIDKEIAEEQRQWELQQQEWSIEDQKKSLQDKLEQVKDEGEEERKQLEEHYRKAKRITESNIMDIIATLAATSPEWMNTGKQLIDALIAGLESGDFSNVQDLIDDILGNDPSTDDPDIPDPGGDGGESEQTPLWSISPGAYRRYGNTTAMWSQDLARLLGVSVSWDQSRGQVIIGGNAFTPLENDNGKTYVSIRQVAEALGYRVEWNDPNVDIYKAAKGGIFTKPALSMMAEAGGSEVAMPLASFQPMLDIAVMRALSQYGGSGTIINYNAPLFNSEKTMIDDDTKAEVVARDIVGLQKSTMRGRGY